MAIELQEVKSSMFSKVGYDENEWVLVVEYRSSGLRLAYQGISPELYEEMMAAESTGKYFNAHIKGKFEAVGDELAAPATKKAPASQEGGLTEEELAYLDPPRAEKIEFVPLDPLPQSTLPSEVTMTKEVTREEVAETYGENVALKAFPEVLPAWDPPKNPVEAIMGLQGRESEINAIIAQNAIMGSDALKLRVVNPQTHAAASSVLTDLVLSKDRTVKLLDPFRSILYSSYQVAVEKLKQATSSLDAAINHLKRITTQYEQEQKRIADQQRLEAARIAEEESKHLQAEQSQQLTLAEIDDALSVGDTERAEQLVSSPIETPRPYVAPRVVEPTILPPAGQHLRDNWKVQEETVDLEKFLRAVKAGSYPIDKAVKVIRPDFPALNKLAKALESAFDVPGFTAWNDPVKSVRRPK